MVALAVSAAQKDKDEKAKDKEQPKAKVYKTPQEVVDVAVAAMTKKDYAVMVTCFTPEAQKQMVVDMAMQGTFMRSQAEGKLVKDKRLKDKDKEEPEPDEKLRKKYKPVFD